jgi:hypothetical protein
MRTEVAGHQEFFGADLRRALSRVTYLGRLTTAYRLTAKTSGVIEGDYQLDRFLFDRARDADSNRLGAGFEIVSITHLTGRAVAGIRSFRLRLPPPSDARASRAFEPYALVDLTFHVGPRTRLGATYDRDLYYSAFAPAGGGRPVIRMETGRVRLEKGLIGNLDLKLYAGLVRLKGDGAVRVERRPGEALVAVRDDTAREAGADLGYVIRRHLRIGLAAGYTERRSTIADFGIRGLLVGATITYIP